MIYLNLKTSQGTETVDSLDKKDFNSTKEYKQELKRLVNEYHISGQNVYISQRSCKQ